MIKYFLYEIKEEKRLDKENLNGIPEEETEAVEETAEVQDSAEEAVQEYAAEDTAAKASEEPVEEISDGEETVAEDSADESEEEYVIPEEDLCPICGEREIAEGSDYCIDCETKMHKRKIPFLGWLAGLLTLGFSVFAFVLTFLVIGPSVVVMGGDVYAAQKNWYAAYNVYSNDVPTVVDEINSYFDESMQLVRTGMGIDKRMVDSMAHYSSPIDAYYLAQSNITDVDLETLPFLDDYRAVYTAYSDTYSAAGETFNMLYEENADLDKICAEFEKYKGTEGVTDLYIDYFKCLAANELGADDAKMLECLNALEASCNEAGGDYSWLYYQLIAEVYASAGETEKALEYLGVLIEADKSKYDAYALSMDIALDSGNLEEADRLVTEYTTNNEGFESAYLLEVKYLRRTGETEKAEVLCTEGINSNSSGIELCRQMSLISMTLGKYADAYDYAMSAYNNAYYYAYYTNDQSYLYDPALNYTIYLSAYLYNSSDEITEENKETVAGIIEEFAYDELPDTVKSVVDGEKTAAQILTEGECDVI